MSCCDVDCQRSDVSGITTLRFEALDDAVLAGDSDAVTYA